MQVYTRPQDILIHQNTHSRNWTVLELWGVDGQVYVYEEGMPASLLPNQGMRLGLLQSIPLSDNSISLIGENKQTSDLTVVARNPDNVWGKLVHRMKLLRRTAAIVSKVYLESGNWNYREQIAIGHVVTFQIKPAFVDLSIQV